MIHFQHPTILYLLILVPVFVAGWIVVRRVNKKKLEKSMRKTLERYKNTKSVKLKQVDKSFQFVKPEEETEEEKA